MIFQSRQRDGGIVGGGRRQGEIRYQNPVFRRGCNGEEDYFEGKLEPT